MVWNRHPPPPLVNLTQPFYSTQIMKNLKKNCFSEIPVAAVALLNEEKWFKATSAFAETVLCYHV